MEIPHIARNLRACKCCNARGLYCMCLRPYFDLCEELVVQGNLIFKGPCLVVPVCMRKELMSMAHATHIGIEGCLRRVRECLFWQAVVRELKTMFSCFGIPEILVTDNGPQFSSNEFQVFAKSWSFNHVTTSPRYPQSNGKAENSLRTVKRLFEKCKETSVSEFQVLLDWRNTPSGGMDTSPAQHLMGRRCRTLLPMSESLLRQSCPLHGDVRALAGRKWRQKNYYDRHVKPLKPINLGKSRFCWSAQLPGKDW